MNNIFIPDRIKVGFQKRDSTYTKKLAYIIYFDEKGKLRKQTSWENWRDKSIDPKEFDNIPTEGFVLNKKVGDYHNCGREYGRYAYIRVYDPRGFEFEITVENLLYILTYCSSIKGKGLEGEFVYGWSGKDLILVPTNSIDYKEFITYSDKMKSKDKIRAKDLIVGATYLDNKNCKLVYLGKYPVWEFGYTAKETGEEISWMELESSGNKIGNKYYRGIKSKKDSYWFAYNKEKDDLRIYYFSNISSKLISIVDEGCAPDFPSMVNALEHNRNFSPIDAEKTEYKKLSNDVLLNRFKNNQYIGVYVKDGDKVIQSNLYIYQGRIGVNGYFLTEEEFLLKDFFYKEEYLANGNLYWRYNFYE